MDSAGIADSPRCEVEFVGIASLPWLSAGTSLATAEGPMPVGWLRAGDTVVTRDRSLQPVLAVGLVKFERHDLLENPGYWPVRIAPEALGRGCPAEPLLVSPWQRVLLQGPELQQTLGLSEALIAARHLIGWPGVECNMPEGGIIAYQVLLRHHELILADGQWSESLYLDAENLAALRRDEPGALSRLGEGHNWLVRPDLRDWEAALLAPPAAAIDGKDFRISA